MFDIKMNELSNTLIAQETSSPAYSLKIQPEQQGYAKQSQERQM